MNTSMGSGTQLTFAELQQPMYQKPNVTVSDFHVRLSVLQESVEALKIQEELYSLRSCGLLKSDTLKYYSLKMLRDCSIMGGYNLPNDYLHDGRAGVCLRVASA